MRETSKRDHFTGIKSMVKTAGSIVPGVPVIAAFGTEGSTYTSETSRDCTKIFVDASKAGDEAEAATIDTDPDKKRASSLTK